MIDKRSALPADFSLHAGGNEIILSNEVSRGANCIVYNALQIDNFGVGHKVRVKEFFPVNLFLRREASGSLAVGLSDRQTFIKAKRRFVTACKKNADIRNIPGLTNSTVNLINLAEENNTCYAVMNFDEGCDYKSHRDCDLKELFEHVKSLAVIIGKYHEKNFLHLDIKPENMLIIPETSEHILLFDFDSIISVEELCVNSNLILSFSDGFAAPEQVQGKIDKIGFHTDIYSIGAVLFYKIFNRRASFDDGKISARYDFTKMNYPDRRYQPALYKKLRFFFRKTLALSPVSRWKNMNVVVENLNGLIELADIKRVFVFDNFHYNTANFIGRSEELAAIYQTLRDNQVIFISGLGGIGKTELAKKYAAINRENYNTIIFCRYSDSIASVVCNEISINGITQEADESDENYFARKISILRETLTLQDLIVVDNFDCDDDENLETLFSCPCKFIITTREDLSDYNFAQLTVDKINDSAELVALFKTYNDRDYSDSEFRAIQKIMQLVDNHTMLIELVAKYLRMTDESPEILLARFLEVEGITNVDAAKVKQRKDMRMRAVSVTEHLRFLFNLSQFSAVETEIMRSLSLLGGVKIGKARFAEMLNLTDIFTIENLIKRGWVEIDDEKISLHQIISDLCFVDLKPSTENCPQITQAMTTLIKKKSLKQTERQINARLSEIFMRRISGNDLSYAELCVCYGKKKYLQRAEDICLASRAVEAYDILQRLYRLKIKFAAQIDFEFFESFEPEELCRQNLIRIGELVDVAKNFCDSFSTEPNYSAKNYSALVFETDEAINSEIIYIADDEFSAELDPLYNKIIAILDAAVKKLLLADKIPREEKISLLEQIRDFYSADDYCAMYRSENFFNPEKQCFCQTQIDVLRGENDAIFARDVTFGELAQNCELTGDFDRAIDYYQKAYEQGEIYDWALYGAAQSCLKAGYTNRAIEYLELILQTDRQSNCGIYTNHACLPLIDVFISEGRLFEAKKLALELLEHNSKENSAYATTWRTVAFFKLFVIESEPDFWKKAVENYRQLDGEKTLSVNLLDFLKAYADTLSDSERDLIELENLINRIERYDREQAENIRAIFERAVKLAENHAEYRIKFLTEYSAYLTEDLNSHFDDALRYCKQAQSFLAQSDLRDDYFQNLIYRAEIICLEQMNCDFSEVQALRRKCDYFLLTARELDGLSDKEKFQTWRDAAYRYDFTDDQPNRLRCLEQAEKISVAEFEENLSLSRDIIDCLAKLKNFSQAKTVTKNLYGKIFRQYFAIQNKIEFNLPQKLRDLAEIFNLIKCFAEAFAVYLISVCAILAPPTEENFFAVPFFNDADEENVCKILATAMDLELTADQIDFVAEAIERLAQLPVQNAFVQKCSELFALFAKKHQFNEIEFKAVTNL